ncbi:hypothetical protein BH23ACT9_BH23ACT9_00370 [soil metagenome]
MTDVGNPSADRAAHELHGGAVDVRPLRFTDILDGSFGLFRSSLRLMIPLVLAVMVPLQLLSAFIQREALQFAFAGIFDDPDAASLLFDGEGNLAGLAVRALSGLLIDPVLAGALVWVAGRRFLGQPVDFGQTLRQTGRMAGWLVLAYIVSALARGIFLVPALLAGTGGSEEAAALALVLGGLAVLLLTPLFAVVTPAILFEPRRPAQAFAHAVRLVRGAYWRTTGIVVGTTLVFNLLALLLAGAPNVIGFIGGFGFAWVLIAFGSVLEQLITAPLIAGAMVLLHADLRVRQEGFDFDLLLDRMQPSAPR